MPANKNETIYFIQITVPNSNSLHNATHIDLGKLDQITITEGQGPYSANYCFKDMIIIYL